MANAIMREDLERSKPQDDEKTSFDDDLDLIIDEINRMTPSEITAKIIITQLGGIATDKDFDEVQRALNQARAALNVTKTKQTILGNHKNGKSKE